MGSGRRTITGSGRALRDKQHVQVRGACDHKVLNLDLQHLKRVESIPSEPVSNHAIQVQEMQRLLG